MSELKALVDAAGALRARGQPFLIATVMRVRGSSYRRAGARMLAADGTWVTGSISGGCLEREVLTKGAWRTREERAVLLTHDEALEENSGSGCQGAIEVLLERDTLEGECDLISFIAGCLRDEEPGVVVTVFRSERSDVPVGARLCVRAGAVVSTIRDPALCAGVLEEAELALRTSTRAQVLTLHGVEALRELIVPPPHLFVFGSAHDAPPLVTLAKQLGWSVSVWDGQPRASARERLRAADRYLRGSIAEAVSELERCAQPLAIVMGHHFEQDRDVLGALLRTAVGYIGVLGPRRRTERMLAECRAQGVPLDPASLARVRSPVGLALGAETPAEIALSIMAEAQSVLTQARLQTPSSEVGPGGALGPVYRSTAEPSPGCACALTRLA
jgi:xanthine/CO dehydrogenase XdhC/CoxF family maturation factor